LRHRLAVALKPWRFGHPDRRRSNRQRQPDSGDLIREFAQQPAVNFQSQKWDDAQLF
jgi:hypothetical protein